MAIAVGLVRTETMKKRHEKMGGFHPDNSCELCRLPVMPDRQRMVPMDHECYEFVTTAEALDRGQAVSLFSVGSDCERRIRRALAATT